MWRADRLLLFGRDLFGRSLFLLLLARTHRFGFLL